MDNKDNIRDKFESFSFIDYDEEKGWARLNKRLHASKQRFVIWRYISAAAVLAVVMFTYFMLKPEKIKPLATMIIPKNIEIKDSALIKPVINNISILQNKENANKNHTVIKKETNIIHNKNESIKTKVDNTFQTESWTEVPHHRDSNLVLRTNKSITQNDQPNTLPIVSASDIETVIAFEHTRQQIKRNRIMQLFINKGEQQEYTSIKESSSKLIQIKF